MKIKILVLLLSHILCILLGCAVGCCSNLSKREPLSTNSAESITEDRTEYTTHLETTDDILQTDEVTGFTDNLEDVTASSSTKPTISEPSTTVSSIAEPSSTETPATEAPATETQATEAPATEAPNIEPTLEENELPGI